VSGMTHVVKLSGGAASAVTDALVVEEFGAEHVQRVFTDTLIEDNDLYRFLIEWCGQMEGADVGDLLPLALALPQVWEDEGGRKAGLAHLRMRASVRLPRLHWLADGRHPFDVFFTQQMMGGGSSGADPCSHLLKRVLADEYIDNRWTPGTAVLYVGIGHGERHRFLGGKGKVGIRNLMRPWVCCSPLVDRPSLNKAALLEFIRSLGIEPPRLYALGFPTNNCGGACVKAGHAWWIHLLNTNRPYYLWWERKEQEFRRITGKDVAILRDRRGGRTRPLTLRRLRELVESQTDLTHLLLVSDRGCGGGCALPTPMRRQRRRAAA
jgi:hypothetical protein